MAIHRVCQELEAAFDEELELEDPEDPEELDEPDEPDDPDEEDEEELEDDPEFELDDDLSELPEAEEVSFFLISEPPLSLPERESVR